MMGRAAFGRREKAKPERSLSLPNARALQDSEARISSIFRAVPAGIGLVVDRVIMEANDRLCEMTGYTREELIGKSARILYPTDEDYEFVGREKYRQIAELGTGTVETRWRRRDGRIIEIILSSTPIRPGDATAGITFTALDISERKLVEEARRLDEQRLEALLRLNQMAEASLQEITDFALEEGVRLTGSEIGYLAFMNEDETVLRMHSWSKSTIAWCSISDLPVLYPVASTGLWGEAVRQRRPVITNDYAAPNPLKKGCPEGHVEIRRHMNVPILDGGRIVAVAGVGNKAGEYDESDVRQLTLLIQGMWRLVQRRQAEAALRESERKFRGVIEQASEGFILVDEAGRIIEYNGAAERIYEWKREKIIGMAFWDYMYMLIPEESRCGLNPDAIRRMIEEYQREGHGPAMGGCSSVNEVNCAGGSRRFTQTINFPIRTDKGHMIGNIVVDVTEQKRAEDALRESEEKFRVLTETTASAIVILQDNKVKYANPAVEKITGYSREEMLAMSPVEAASIIDPASILMLNLTRFRRRGKNENLRYEIRLKAKGGRMKWVDVTTGVISYNGSPAFLATGLDITERKQAEEKLRASLHEKEVLLKEIHHRVKNNLQVVSSMLSLQSMHLDDPADASMFRESQDRIRSMALIHEKLYQSGDLSRIDFNEYVRNLTANLLRSYGVGAGTIKLKIDVGDILLGIDQAIPCGLIVNELVSNAFKYAFPGGRRGEISVAMGRNGEKFTLVVADNGVGMPESVDYLRTKSLGLQLVNTFVEQLEGKISLDRTAGTKFAIVFREKKGRRG